jgi:RNase P protein component
LWTRLEAPEEAVGQDYVIMWRQKASDVVFPKDVETIRNDLEEGCKQLQGFHYQIVLCELQTLSGHPDRLHA